MKTIKLVLLALLCGYSGISFSQTEGDVKLMVYVQDETKNPVAGAVILINGAKQKMLTNKNGYFRVKLDKAPKTISAFSPTIGLKKVAYKGEQKVVINLLQNKEYQVVNDVNKKTLDPVQFRNIYDYLRGRVPGVDVSTSNEITIRGFNTVNGSTTPLFIVNGVQVSQDIFGNIVPMQIQKITILKGPDAAAYGSRGANGVIVVDTN
jgi:TonB-dependent SusC/RagA subfamily outer membrane receptor